MIKRTIYIGNPAYLKVKQQQLWVQDPKNHEKLGTVPIEDMALLLLDHPQITLSHQLIQQLMGRNVAVISCDGHHLPHGIMLPLYGHSTTSERLRNQVEASMPLKKQLWKQTIVAKITNQRALLQQYKKPTEAMTAYLQEVNVGDTKNMEGKAAAHFWKHIFDSFTRDRFGDSPNNFLNYGYAILRSMVARALVSSGLSPSFGIFHRNRYNPYCLADDVMEPYRPFVDQLVLQWIYNNPNVIELTKEGKAHLLTIATEDVYIDGKKRPLMVALSTTSSSLYKCYTGERRNVIYPVL